LSSSEVFFENSPSLDDLDIKDFHFDDDLEQMIVVLAMRARGSEEDGEEALRIHGQPSMHAVESCARE
jgi:hypothetical protein